MHTIQTFPTNFLVRKFSVNRQFPWISGRITQKSAETVRLWKMHSPDILHSEKCKQLINKIYSFNNIAMLC